jgi:hypothetical protein
MLRTRAKPCGRPYGWPHPARNHAALGKRPGPRFRRDKASLSGRLHRFAKGVLTHQPQDRGPGGIMAWHTGGTSSPTTAAAPHRLGQCPGPGRQATQATRQDHAQGQGKPPHQAGSASLQWAAAGWRWVHQGLGHHQATTPATTRPAAPPGSASHPPGPRTGPGQATAPGRQRKPAMGRCWLALVHQGQPPPGQQCQPPGPPRATASHQAPRCRMWHQGNPLPRGFPEASLHIRQRHTSHPQASSASHPPGPSTRPAHHRRPRHSPGAAPRP